MVAGVVMIHHGIPHVRNRLSVVLVLDVVDQRKWYVLHVDEGEENKAATSLAWNTTMGDRRMYPSQPGLLQPGILPSSTGPTISAMAQNSFCPLMENIMNTRCPLRSYQTALMRSLQLGRLVTP